MNKIVKFSRTEIELEGGKKHYIVSVAPKRQAETKRIFISHKSECAVFGKFLVRCFELSGMDVQKSVIFTSMPELGVPYDQDIYQYLKDCFREDLYVIFLFSRSFYNSNVCIAETGAAWATNQKYSNVVIDMGFGGIDKPINSSQLGVSLADIDAECCLPIS